MGENLEIEGRLSVRTPMQWTDERNGGFSPSRPSRLPRPVVEGEYGPVAVNVAEQRRDPDSLLNWMERIVRRRRECPEFGFGTAAVLDPGDNRVLVHQCDWDGSRVVAVHNLSAEPRQVRVVLPDVGDVDRVVDLLTTTEPVRRLEAQGLDLTLEGYGFRWYRLQREGTTTAP